MDLAGMHVAGSASRSSAEPRRAERYPATNAVIFAATLRASLGGSLPIRRKIRVASTVASFAGRTTEGAGRPALFKSETATSQSHAGLSGLVTIKSQTRP